MNTKSVVGPDIFPTWDNCDLSNPEEMFLPAFVGAPGVTGGALPLPVVWLKKLSKHFHELGIFIRCPKCGHRGEATKHLVLPDDPHQLVNTPVWHDGPAPKRMPPGRRDILQKMTRAELLALQADAASILDHRDEAGGIQ
jgi:hypothetical protein